MITCTKCGEGPAENTLRCPVNPENDEFLCRKCGHKFKRYDEPVQPEKRYTMREVEEGLCDLLEFDDNNTVSLQGLRNVVKLFEEHEQGD